MNEIRNNDSFVKNNDISFNPDKRITEYNKTESNESQSSYNPDKRIGTMRFENPDPMIDNKKLDEFDFSDYNLMGINSTMKERMDHVPKNPEKGTWTGKVGESKYKPNDSEAKKKLAEKGLDGIEYKEGIPDFKPVSEATVKIDNMTDQRYGKGGNFEQCDQKCAENWNNEAKEGKTDWTARDVANYRAENNMSWHECNDMETCELVPQSIHSACTHLGGVSECKKNSNENNGGIFDE